METKALKPYFVIIGLMLVTVFAIAFTVDVRITDEAGVRIFLPDQVGEWRGQEMRFCQNPVCGKELRVADLKVPDVCPTCGGPLDTMTADEKAMLPPDTRILKKYYTNPSSRSLFVSIVLSGRERASIHRPQVCLVGQGNEIIHSYVLGVPLEGRKPLDVMVLDMLRRGRGADGKPYENPTFFAYWFVGKGRETPYHIQRMIWMATDRIFRNVSHRWAYIAVAGGRDEDSTAYQEQIRTFLHDLYPQVLLNQG
ncbi:MAG: exosortase-associated EpsI family protein [Verrucomicrobiota bacterium]